MGDLPGLQSQILVLLALRSANLSHTYHGSKGRLHHSILGHEQIVHFPCPGRLQAPYLHYIVTTEAQDVNEVTNLRS